MILCCGEALIDMLPDVNGKGEHVLRPVTGGSVFNTAIALGRLEETTGFFSGVSNDGFGRKLIADLEDSSVDHSLCLRSDRPTTLAVVDLSDGNATYTFYDEGSAGREILPSDMPAVPGNVSTLLFGGISLIPEPCGSAYESLLIENSANHLTYIDPNIRPNFIDDEDKHRTRIRRMIEHSDIVKVSDEDLSWIEPNMDFNATAQKWLGHGTSIILISRGGDGSEAHFKGGVVKAPAEKITVADTVGAGDTFSAGFLSSLNGQIGLGKQALASLDETVLQRALAYANKAAAITASRVGANPPRLNEMSGDVA
ncbi:carbohydrate kinase [Pseudahrensia aquimaris]|uniref:Carbohydrate kinase n=1 Tax=Pseudahrensia aquimaris TaxID=744461 RepID=A0ABW3FIP2_9HYPH